MQIQLHFIAPALLNIMSTLLNNGYNTAARKDSICQPIPYLLFSLERVHYCNPVAGSLTDKQKFYLKEAGSFALEEYRHLGTGMFCLLMIFLAVTDALTG